MWSWLGKQRIKVRTIDENSNLVSSGRKILRSCDRQGHVTCVWQMRGCWQVSPTFSGPRENRYPAKITTDDISPLFQSLTGERIYGMEIYAVFCLREGESVFPGAILPSRGHSPASLWSPWRKSSQQPCLKTHTHTPADECSVEGLPLWPRGLDQHTHTFTHAEVIYLCVSVSVIWF